MSPIDPIDPNAFDLKGLDAAADTYEKAQRTSQRREARKLQPLIERLLTRKPDMLTADVLKVLRTVYLGGALPTSATFVREIGSICREVRECGGRGRGGARKPKAVPPREPGSSEASNGAGCAPVHVSSASPRTPTPAVPKVDLAAAAGRHPLDIYAGTFGGKVWIHGPQIRAFFSAVEKGLDDRTLKTLALQAQVDATSRAKLTDLHPKDRSIFAAALTLA